MNTIKSLSSSKIRSSSISRLTPEGSLSYADKAALLSDALLISNAVEVLSEVSKKGDISQSDKAILKDAQGYIGKLEKAESYLSEPPMYFMPQPDGVEIVTAIEQSGWRDIDESIAFSNNILDSFLKGESFLWKDEYKLESVEKVLKFFRIILQMIMDQVPDSSKRWPFDEE